MAQSARRKAPAVKLVYRPPNPVDAGQVLRTLRIYRQMSQSDLARTTGMGQVNISRWEQGQAPEDFFDTYETLAGTFGVPLGLFFQDPERVEAIISEGLTHIDAALVEFGNTGVSAFGKKQTATRAELTLVASNKKARGRREGSPLVKGARPLPV